MFRDQLGRHPEGGDAKQENQKAYDELKAAKEEDITAGQEQIGSETPALATTNEKLAESKDDLEEFLTTLKEKCSTTDAEWEESIRRRARWRWRLAPMLLLCEPHIPNTIFFAVDKEKQHWALVQVCLNVVFVFQD